MNHSEKKIGGEAPAKPHSNEVTGGEALKRSSPRSEAEWGSSFRIGIGEISFYYDEMIRSHLVELEIETPNGKLILKRSQKENDLYKGFPTLRRKTDFLPFPEKDESSQPSVSGHVISSPITGVFYRSSSPQSPPLVKEGESVAAGATLCIVEAMKVMNEIKSEKRCKIVKILAENGKPVTNGQALFQAELLEELVYD